jgi:putative FmdB family regulatory protein
MPEYTYRCLKCGHIFDYIECIAHRNNTQVCPGCNGPAERDVEHELSRSTQDQCDHTRYSWALGVCNPNNPEEMKVAHENHPGAEFDKMGRMIIHNRKEKLQRMKEKSKAIGQDWVEYD